MTIAQVQQNIPNVQAACFKCHICGTKTTVGTELIGDTEYIHEYCPKCKILIYPIAHGHLNSEDTTPCKK